MEYLQKLEYNKILEKLYTYCHIETSRQKALNLKPESNYDQVQKLLAQTTEAVNLIYRCSTPPEIQFEEDKKVIQILEKYEVLSLKSILNFTKILKIANQLKEYFNKDFINIEEFPILEPMFEKLYTNLGIIDKIEKSIIDEQTVDDNASKNLATIRKKQRNLEQEIKQKLTNMIHSSTYAKYIQESIITIRNERYVIPVKEEYRTQIKGFVHDISGSGATIFIEPIIIFELNNQMTNLKVEELNEIENIIKELSKLFYPYVEEIKDNIQELANLDFIFAKAKYARDIKAEAPQINQSKQIILDEACHPLIDSQKVVPISVKLGKTYKTLVVTGPNTGGKTVTLKTVGLLTCMACSGLHIPAKKKSSIYVFNKIFADIGDDQSIADSLSTFSAHIKNIVDIIENADENSLVLVDELGSGTDPIEGQALAISILEYLKNKNILTLATTHYQELKKYALMTKDFENASVEFDIETLTPTYHLLVGVPGKSNAFEISKKLGLREDIIKKSKNRIEKNDIEFEEVIKQIYRDKNQIEKEKQQISIKLQEVEKLQKKLEKDNDEKLKKQQEEIQKAKIEARNILLQAKEEANSIIKNIEELQKSAEKEASRKANILRNELNERIKETQNVNILEKNYLKEQDNKNIQPNTLVYVQNLGKEGITLSKVSKSNEVIVQIGSMKINVPIQNVKVLEKTDKEIKCKNNQVNIHTQVSKTKIAKTEINVIGMNIEEACIVIDKFLDDSYLAKIQTVRIIHGKGTGKLRKGIHQQLAKHPHVKSYRIGTFGEGEMGVTVVEL